MPIKPEDRVAVKDPSGEIVYISRDAAGAALRDEGFSPVSKEELDAKLAGIKREESFKGVSPAAGAFTAGALRAASVGTSDDLAATLANIIGGPEARKRVADQLSGYKEFQPVASGAGEVVGFGGSLLIPGAGEANAAKGLLGGAARVASAPMRAVTALGAAAEHGLAGALGAGSKVLPMAARAGVEGAVLGAGNALSDAALSQDPELTAEHILPDILSGALGGLVIGGATGTVLKGAGKLFSKAKPLVKAAEAGLASEMAAKEGMGVRERIGAALDAKANELATQSANPTLEQLRNVEKRVGAVSRGEKAIEGAAVEKSGIQNFGKIVLEEIDSKAAEGGKSIGRYTDEDYRALGAEGKSKYGKVGGSIIKEVAALPTEAQTPGVEVIDKLLKRAEEMKGPLGDAETAKPFQKMVEDFADKAASAEKSGVLDLEDIYKRRIKLDSEAYVGKFETASAEKLAKREFANVLEQHIVDEIGKAEGALGRDALSEYFDAKKRFQVSTILSDMSEDAAIRGIKNQRFGLSDKMLLAGSFAVNPVIGTALAFGNKFLREQGESIAADLTHRAAKIFTINQAAQAAEKEMGASISAFINPKEVGKSLFYAGAAEPVFVGRTQDERQKSFDTYVTALKDRVSNPQMAFDNLSKRMGDMGTVTPQTAAHVISKAMEVDKFVASKLPAGLTPTNTMFPNKVKPQVSDSELAQFGRYVAVAQKGSKVLLNELKNHHVNKETVEAVRVMFPAIYARIQAEIIRHAISMEKDLTYSQKLQLYPLFGISPDPVMSPASLAIFQANYTQKTNAARGLTHSGKPSKSMRGMIAQQYQTGTQAIEQGDQ